VANLHLSKPVTFETMRAETHASKMTGQTHDSQNSNLKQDEQIIQTKFGALLMSLLK